MGRMSDLYEYVSVELPKRSAGLDRQITTALNDVAGHGWRLVGLLPYEGLWEGQAIFEREVRE